MRLMQLFRIRLIAAVLTGIALAPSAGAAFSILDSTCCCTAFGPNGRSTAVLFETGRDFCDCGDACNLKNASTPSAAFHAACNCDASARFSIRAAAAGPMEIIPLKTEAHESFKRNAVPRSRADAPPIYLRNLSLIC